ncbi:hypothetical protein DIPPA_01476 [Diplonema papillatum]|nr:hypothetical protein DIPPA_01476 [Diplonema papillatum]
MESITEDQWRKRLLPADGALGVASDMRQAYDNLGLDPAQPLAPADNLSAEQRRQLMTTVFYEVVTAGRATGSDAFFCREGFRVLLRTLVKVACLSVTEFVSVYEAAADMRHEGLKPKEISVCLKIRKLVERFEVQKRDAERKLSSSRKLPVRRVLVEEAWPKMELTAVYGMLKPTQEMVDTVRCKQEQEERSFPLVDLKRAPWVPRDRDWKDPENGSSTLDRGDKELFWESVGRELENSADGAVDRAISTSLMRTAQKENGVRLPFNMQLAALQRLIVCWGVTGCFAQETTGVHSVNHGSRTLGAALSYSAVLEELASRVSQAVAVEYDAKLRRRLSLTTTDEDAWRMLVSLDREVLDQISLKRQFAPGTEAPAAKTRRTEEPQSEAPLPPLPKTTLKVGGKGMQATEGGVRELPAVNALKSAGSPECGKQRGLYETIAGAVNESDHVHKAVEALPVIFGAQKWKVEPDIREAIERAAVLTRAELQRGRKAAIELWRRKGAALSHRESEGVFTLAPGDDAGDWSLRRSRGSTTAYSEPERRLPHDGSDRIS